VLLLACDLEMQENDGNRPIVRRKPPGTWSCSLQIFKSGEDDGFALLPSVYPKACQNFQSISYVTESRSVLFWDITLSSSGNLLPTFLRPLRCPEKSVKDCHSTLRNIPEEHRSRQNRDGSVKSRLPKLSCLQGTQCSGVVFTWTLTDLFEKFYSA
jgi:hypothetical protein